MARHFGRLADVAASAGIARQDRQADQALLLG